MTNKPTCATLPAPPPTGDDTLDRLLLALSQSPTDTVLPQAVADRLEEASIPNGSLEAAAVRRVHDRPPQTEDVAQRIWPGCRSVHVGSTSHTKDSRGEIHSRHGGFLCSWRSLADQIQGRTLLVDPAVAEAVAIEKAAAVLRLFCKEQEAAHV